MKYIHELAKIDDDVQIGRESKIWHWTHVSSGAKIGDNCTLGQNVFIGKNVKIGNNVKIQNNVSIFEGVELGDQVFCGPSVVFTNVINPRSFINKKKEFQSTKVLKGVTIGANSTIICGINIGEYAFIGAGSVVTKDVKKFEKYYGNPASHKGWVTIEGNNISFTNKNSHLYCCPVSKKKYFYDKLKNEVNIIK